ncbi:agmatinase [Candidatus Woesearchaeota archaeon]|nr:agmatinase [Candidatus Woesearchaeota archaeon]
MQTPSDQTSSNHTTPNFCGMEEQDFSKSKAVVLPVAYEGTVSYLKGTSKGPAAIIEASRNMEIYDIELDVQPDETDIFTTEEITHRGENPEEMMEKIKKEYSILLDSGKFIVMLGGEHSVTNGALQALKEKGFKGSILQIDAHADLREEYEGTKNNHACAMRRAREMFHCVQAGIRSMSVQESRFIKDNKIDTIFYAPLTEEKIPEIISKLKDDVYITIDLDGLDPSIMPGVGTPEPNGLSYEFLLRLLRAAFEKRNVIGADVVELMPLPDNKVSDFTASLITYKLILYKLFLAD